MTGDCHAGIRGSPGVRFPRATRPRSSPVVHCRSCGKQSACLDRRADEQVGLGGSRGEGRGRNPAMHDRREVGRPVVPAKPPNNVRAGRRRRWREGDRPRGTRPAKRVPDAVPEGRAQWAGSRAPSGSKDKDARFTALLHHVDVDRLRAAYRAIAPEAAPGVDGVTWEDYGQDLEDNLRDLHARVHAGGTERSRRGGRTSRSRTGGSDRSESPRWRTRSSSGRWSRC